MSMRIGRLTTLMVGLTAMGLAVVGCTGTGSEGVDDPMVDAMSGSDNASPDDVGESQGEIPEAETGGAVPTDLVVDVLNEPDSLDPLYRSTVEAQVYFRNVYSSLLAWEEDGTLAPDLAAVLPTESEDRLSYEVQLQDGLTFHDGSDLTAEDVVYSYQEVANPETGSAWRSALIFLESVEAVDDTTVRFTLSRPYTYFDTRMAMVPIISADDAYVTNETYATSANGSGPFMLGAYNQGESIVLERWDDYHGADYPMETITYQLVPENASRIARLTNGETDIVPNLPADQLELVTSRGAEAATVEDNVSRLFFYVSHAEDRPTSNADFRLALAWAIDRGALIDQVFDGAAATNATYLAKGTQFADEELTNFFGTEPDLAKAQEHLEAAGGAPDRPFEMVVTNEPDLIAAATIMQSNLAELGIDVRIEVAEVAAFFPRLVSGDYDVLLYRSPVSTAVGFAPDYSYGGLYSESPSNFNSFSDPKMDELLNDAISAPIEDAAPAWHAVQEYDLETQGQVQILVYQYSEGWSPDLTGYSPSKLAWLNNLKSLAD